LEGKFSFELANIEILAIGILEQIKHFLKKANLVEPFVILPILAFSKQPQQDETFIVIISVLFLHSVAGTKPGKNLSECAGA
jgi:hypothetical protein